MRTVDEWRERRCSYSENCAEVKENCLDLKRNSWNCSTLTGVIAAEGLQSISVSSINDKIAAISFLCKLSVKRRPHWKRLIHRRNVVQNVYLCGIKGLHDVVKSIRSRIWRYVEMIVPTVSCYTQAVGWWSGRIGARMSACVWMCEWWSDRSWLTFTVSAPFNNLSYLTSGAWIQLLMLWEP